MDFKFFIEQLINRLHLMLLQEVGVEKKESQIPFNLLEIEKLFEILTTAYQETKAAVLAQMPLELAILEWGEVQGQVAGGSQTHVVQDTRKDSTQFQDKSRSLNESRQPTAKDSQNAEGPAFSSFANSSASPKINNNSFFSKLIDEVKLQNHLIAGVLRSCSAEEIKNGKLNIIAKSKFHKEKLDEAKTRKLLEECADKISGEQLTIQITLGPA
jgi:hypothetical protein